MLCTRDFWTEVKRQKHTDRRVSSNIDGCYDNTEIANVFADKYNDPYSCVGYDDSRMRLLKQEIDDHLSNLSNSSLASDCLINSNEVCDAAKYLKCNKRDAFSGLSSDYVINSMLVMNFLFTLHVYFLVL